MSSIMNEGMLQFASAIVCVALGGLSGYLSNFNDLSWYDGLKQPPFRPPNWLFGIVWTILYTLIGIAFGTFIATGAPSGLIGLFIIHFGFNFAWSLIFFKYHFLKYSFIWIAALWAMILLMIYWSTGINCTLFGNVFPVNYLFAPYLCWVYFASVLNGSVYALNGE